MKWLFPAVCGGLILALAVSLPRAQDAAVGTAPTTQRAGTDKASPTTSKEAAPAGAAIETPPGDKTNTIRDPHAKLPIEDRSGAKRADDAKGEPKADASDDEFKIFRLRRASADSIRNAIIQIYSDEFNHGKLNIMADVRTNSLLLRAPEGLSAKVRDLVISLDEFETTARDSASTPDAGEKPDVSSGRASHRERHGQAYRQHEDQAGRLATAYRNQRAATPADRQKLERLKSELQAEVSAAFEARQELQRADLNRLRGRLAQIERQIEAREQRAQEIISNRIDELLHPEKEWEAGDDPADPAAANQRLDSTYPRRSAGGRGPEVRRQQAAVDFPQGETHAELIREDQPPGGEASVSFVDRRGTSLFRDASANPRKALLDAESAIASARAAAAQADKALPQARDIVQRISQLAKQGEIPQRELLSAEAELAAQEARRDRARIDLEQAERQAALAREDLAAQIDLLKVDLNDAALNLEQASREETRMKALISQKVISAEEADLKSLALQQARLQYQRAKTLYELYRKALPEGGSAGGNRPTDEKSPTKRDDTFGTGKKD